MRLLPNLSLSDTRTRTQEFVMPGKSGANLKRPFEGKNIMLNDLTPSGVAQLAHWERCIRDRYTYTWCIYVVHAQWEGCVRDR